MDPAFGGAVRDRLAPLTTETPGLELVVMFGSAARGRTHSQSDLDVAVLSDGVSDLDALYLALAPKLESARLDLVDLRRAGPILAFEIARSGLLLFERSPGSFRRFQSLASRRYADT